MQAVNESKRTRAGRVQVRSEILVIVARRSWWRFPWIKAAILHPPDSGEISYLPDVPEVSENFRVFSLVPGRLELHQRAVKLIERLGSPTIELELVFGDGVSERYCFDLWRDWR